MTERQKQYELLIAFYRVFKNINIKRVKDINIKSAPYEKICMIVRNQLKGDFTNDDINLFSVIETEEYFNKITDLYGIGNVSDNIERSYRKFAEEVWAKINERNAKIVVPTYTNRERLENPAIEKEIMSQGIAAMQKQMMLMSTEIEKFRKHSVQQDTAISSLCDMVNKINKRMQQSTPKPAQRTLPNNVVPIRKPVVKPETKVANIDDPNFENFDIYIPDSFREAI